MQVRFSGLLLRFTGYERTATIQAGTVEEALALLRRRFPELGPVLWNDDGQLRGVHRLIVNGEVVPTNGSRALCDTDEIEFLTAIAGG